MADALKVRDSVVLRVEVDDFSASKKHKLVEELVRLRVWLVNRLNNGTARLGKIPEDLHKNRRGIGVKSRRRLVQEDQTWLRDELNRDRRPLPLSSGHSLEERATNACLGALIELKVINDSVNLGLQVLAVGAMQSETRCEFDALADSESFKKNVVLLDVGGKSGVALDLFGVLTIDHDVTINLEISGCQAPRKMVEQGGLTRT